jgi:hypothetical protein
LRSTDLSASRACDSNSAIALELPPVDESPEGDHWLAEVPLVGMGPGVKEYVSVEKRDDAGVHVDIDVVDFSEEPGRYFRARGDKPIVFPPDVEEDAILLGSMIFSVVR